MTTVGYGDRYPTTGPGRAVGAVLMVVGIALFGFLAASVSALFVRKDVAKDVDPHLDEISARLERIEDALAAMAARGNQPPTEAVKTRRETVSHGGDPFEQRFMVVMTGTRLIGHPRTDSRNGSPDPL